MSRTDVDHRDIHLLSSDLANKIAAGEVVERPASVVKELVENAVDAGAASIEIEVRDGGREYIRVTDNGTGIRADQLPLAFLRHATSKITTFEDLSGVLSLGFRGEALPSIASCAEVEMISSTGGEAARLVVRGGQVAPVESWPGPPGTTVTVRRLFYNTPARYKFLKQPSTEKRYTAEYISSMALAHPNVSFRLIGEYTQMLFTSGKGDLLMAIGAIYGAALAKRLIPVHWDSPLCSVQGYVSPPDINRANRSQETVFVNGRWVQNRLLHVAVEKGYDSMLASRRFPVAVLHLSVDPTQIDVNVHPAKTEIRFRHESETFKAIMMAVRSALSGADLTPRMRELDHRSAGRTDRSATTQAMVCEEPTRLFSSSTMAVRESAAILDVGNHRSEVLTETSVSDENRAVREFLTATSPLGQVLHTYLLLPSPYGLWLVDQHAAHERVLYEEVLARDQETVQQALLTPLSLQFAPAEATLLEEQHAVLADLGFVLEDFGSSSLLIRAVPATLGGPPDEHTLREMLLELAATWDARGPSPRERAAAIIACKAAIKAGERLDFRKQVSLLRSLAQTQDLFTCPHGRPTMIAIDQQELEKRFGRR